MFSIPLVAILAPLGLIIFLASLINPWLAALPASALALLLHAITGLIQRISHAQAADFRVPGPTLAHALIALACFAFCCWAVRRTRTLAWTAVAVLPLATAIILWPSPPAVHLNQLEVTAIDVGQGDSLLVVSPNGRAMLLDAGGPTGAAANAENAATLTSENAFDIGEQVVSPYLWSRHGSRPGRPRRRRCPHPRAFRPYMAACVRHPPATSVRGELWVAVDPDSAPYRALLAEANTLGIRVRHLRAGDRPRLRHLHRHLRPRAHARLHQLQVRPPTTTPWSCACSSTRASALFEGDAESPSERAMSAASLTNPNLRLGPDNLLKVGHHGSRTSTTPEFLSLVAPQAAIVSVGANNTFGHPRPEIIDRLRAAHARVFRTDRSGLTTFLLSRDGGISGPPATAPNP